MARTKEAGNNSLGVKLQIESALKEENFINSKYVLLVHLTRLTLSRLIIYVKRLTKNRNFTCGVTG